MPTIQPSKIVPGVRPDPHDLLVYWVKSSRPEMDEWRVDLQKFCGNGECPCEKFKFKILKWMVRRALPAMSFECPHIVLAKRYFTFECLNRIIENREKAANENKIKARKSRMDRSIPGPAPEAEPIHQAPNDFDDENVPF